MSDPWVTNVQIWINTTYGHIPAIGTVPTDGKTGWPIMYALTRALQRELGITSLSDTFGETTLGMLGAMAPISATPPAGGETSAAVQKYRRIVKIVQAAMYCKGYNGGDGEINGIWSTTTTAGIVKLRGDMGISTTNKDVSPKVFKALLNMDAYILVSGGSATVRTIQRELNSRYAGGRKEFYIIPTDGFYSRDVQRGMMYAIQYELGMSDSVANGNFGPGTKQGLSDHANFTVNGTGFLVKLYQAALIFNGFTTLYSTTFTSNTAAVTREFQAFCKLDVNGRSDVRTWASLLVSTGDPERPVTACDASKTITAARADTLVGLGYQVIGRYLSNEPGTGTIDKEIKPGELATIFSKGLRVFPIFQEGGTVLGYFNYGRGVIAARNAYKAARRHGFKNNTVIYFAIDFDAMEHEVLSNIVPYFTAIKATLAEFGNPYRVGIYASRNTCSIIARAGLAELSFVSGMSTGFSGNLGYPLPYNWAFDQIKEMLVGSGDGGLDIDKDVASGLDSGQNSVESSPIGLNVGFFDYLTKVQNLAAAWKASHPTAPSANNLVLQYLRAPDYGQAYWAPAAGSISTDFVAHVDATIQRQTTFIDPHSRQSTGISHLAATANGVTYNGIPPQTGNATFVADITGWAGDLISLVAEYRHSGTSLSAYEFGMRYLGGFQSGYFAPEDLIQDVDGFNLAVRLLTTPGATVAGQFKSYYADTSGGWSTRYTQFSRTRFGASTPNMRIAARNALGGTVESVLFGTMRAGISVRQGVDWGQVTNSERDAFADAFRDTITNRVWSES